MACFFPATKQVKLKNADKITFTILIFTLSFYTVVTKSKILAYSMLTVGVLGALFFNNNMNLIPYTIIYKILSIILALAAMVFLFTIPPDSKLREQMQLKYLIEGLKENGATLKVDLTRCSILENSYTEAHEARPMFEAIAFGELQNIMPADDNKVLDKTSQTKLENITLTILVYETEVMGQQRKFYSQVIHKDRATLMFLLEAQKYTLLYYDKNNPARCYFVLDFLDS